MATIKDSRRGLLVVPLGACANMPTRRFYKDLEETAVQLNRSRKGMARAWLRWREDNTEFVGMELISRDGSVAVVPAIAPAAMPHPIDSGTTCVFSTWLYYAGISVAPSVSTSVMASLAKDVVSNLTTKAIRKEGRGRHNWRWQAILDHDENCWLPNWDSLTLLVPNGSACLCHNGVVSGRPGSNEMPLSQAALRLPLFSKKSGRRVMSPVVRLNVGALSDGNRRVFAAVVRGEYKFCDSKLVKRDDRWYLHLCYERPTLQLGLDASNVATVWCLPPAARKPFLIRANAGMEWFCGEGLWLAWEYGQVVARRRHLRNRYSEQTSGVKGHGRARFEARLKPWSRSVQNLQTPFRRRLVNEFVRFCQKYDCGKVVFKVPTLALRPHLWFGKREVPLDYTQILSELRQKLTSFGIEFTEEDCTSAELRENFPRLYEDRPAETTPPPGRFAGNGRTKTTPEGRNGKSTKGFTTKRKD